MSEAFGQYLDVLAQTEWLPPHDLARYQDGLLERIVGHAIDNIPFYRERLSCLIKNEGVSLARWVDVPILERVTAAKFMSALQSPSLTEDHGPTGDIHTTGTVGVPLTFSITGLLSMASNAAFTRAAYWHGVDTSRPLASIRVYRAEDAPVFPNGATSKGWSRMHPNADHYSLDLRTLLDQQLDWLLRHRAPYLMTSASNAMALAYEVTPAQARALGFEFVFSIGETVIPGARELIKEKLGAKLIGLYSCSEIGHIATECPMSPHYHVVAEHAVVEILNDDGSPADPGEVGRVIVTGLYNYATPFIRYAIGDVAVRSVAPCVCGRSLPIITHVEGRTRSAFIFADGTRKWPRSWDAEALRSFVPYREFQMVQLDFERIEFRYVDDGSSRTPDLIGLGTYARKALHPSVTMTLRKMSAIPRSGGGKFEQFVSMVAANSDSGPDTGIDR